jgi:hypothetical protein
VEHIANAGADDRLVLDRGGRLRDEVDDIVSAAKSSAFFPNFAS